MQGFPSLLTDKQVFSFSCYISELNVINSALPQLSFNLFAYIIFLHHLCTCSVFQMTESHLFMSEVYEELNVISIEVKLWCDVSIRLTVKVAKTF